MVAYSFYENDNRIMRYADALVMAGYNVDVLALNYRNQRLNENIRGVNVKRIQTRHFPERANKFAYLWRLGRFLIKSLILLAYYHIKQPYDLIHIHSIPDFEVFAAVIPKLLGCKIILDIHDIVPEYYCSKFDVKKDSTFFKLLVLVEKWSIRFSDHVIIANHLWYEKIISRSVTPAKCTVVLNYPDTNIFKKKDSSKNNKSFVMMYPGTINHHQGLDIAVRAFKDIEDQIPHAVFLIYGEGPDRKLIEKLIQQLGLKDRVQIFDPLPIIEIAEKMAQADLAIIPKRSDSFGDEAFSTKSFEFMTVGVPLLMSETTIDRYYFNDKVVEFFESGNKNDLALKMLELYMNPDRREKLKRNGYKFICRYRWDSRKDEYLDLVLNLVHGRSFSSGIRMQNQRRHIRPYPMYYKLKNFLPRKIQIFLRKLWVRSRRIYFSKQWPIDHSAGFIPNGFRGWPCNKQFAFVLRHDIESSCGHDLCTKLIDIDERFGMRSAFFLVPEAYNVSPALRKEIVMRGGEVGVHGLIHDGKLYSSHQQFLDRAARINQYMKEWDARGFASPSAHHELNWIDAIKCEYDSSTFDTDPFEPQPDSVKTIFPFIVNNGGNYSFVELPYTMVQDFTLFVLMGKNNISIWKEKLDWIASRGGMVLVTSHPDYMQFPGDLKRSYTYPVELYEELLQYVSTKYAGKYWNALPYEITKFWRSAFE